MVQTDRDEVEGVPVTGKGGEAGSDYGDLWMERQGLIIGTFGRRGGVYRP